MNLLDILSYGFIQRALLAGTLIALLCSVLGVFLVLRRLSLIGDGLAHVTFGSTAIALALHIYSAMSLLVSAPIVMLASLGILKLSEKGRLSGDAAIGLVSALGISVGIILARVGGGTTLTCSATCLATFFRYGVKRLLLQRCSVPELCCC